MRPQPADLVPGNRYHIIGNVVVQGGHEMVCVRVSDCNATFVPVNPGTKTVEFSKVQMSEETGDLEEVKVSKTLRVKSREVALSNQYFPPDRSVVRYMNPVEMEQRFRKQPSPEAASEPNETTSGEQNERTESMPKAKTASTPKTERSNAGRSAYIHKQKAAGAKKLDIFEGVQKRWPWTGKPLFDKIFDRQGHGNGSAPKASGKKASSAPPPPPAPPAAPPVPPAAAPASPEAPKAPEAPAAS